LANYSAPSNERGGKVIVYSWFDGLADDDQIGCWRNYAPSKIGGDNNSLVSCKMSLKEEIVSHTR
jgi:hypothetical protein